MPPDPSQEPQRRETEALRPSTGDLHARSYLRHLVLPETALRSTLELLQSYQTVLQADMNLARLFEVPLASDLKAERLSPYSQRASRVHWRPTRPDALFTGPMLSYPQHMNRNSRLMATTMSGWIRVKWRCQNRTMSLLQPVFHGRLLTLIHILAMSHRKSILSN